MASYWYNPHKYFLNLDETDFFCVAPNKYGNRCSYDISIEELAEANLCKANAYHMQPGPERDYELQRHVLARCCGDHHRGKLGARADAARWCLEDVGTLFSNMLARPDLNAPRALRSGRQRSPLPASEMIRKYNGELRERDPLPPRVTSARMMPPIPQIPLSPFVPVGKSPTKSINEVFLENAALENQQGSQYGDGFVYIFSWPDHPGFVKIGYSRNVWKRLRYLQECHPGLKCVYEERFSFPERMERLVHLELHDRRKKIEICPSCGSTHHEWFEVSDQQAVDTIAGWSRVVQRAPIYQSYGDIHPEWKTRLTGDQVINAVMLNRILDSEDHIKRVQVIQAAAATAATQAVLTAQAATVVTATTQAVLTAQAATMVSAVARSPSETVMINKSSAGDEKTFAVARKPLPPRNNAGVKVMQPGVVERAEQSDKQAFIDEIVSVHEAVDEVLLAFSEFMGSLKIAGSEPRKEVADVIARSRRYAVPVC